MEAHIENREAFINDLKARLKEHWESVEKTILSLKMQKNEATRAVRNIEEKLKAAEERRLSLEADRKTHLANMISKIEKASKRRSEQANNFISQTREVLEQKMEAHIENRESFITDLKSRLREHWESVEKTRLTLKMQTREAIKAAEEKHSIAAAQRDENIKNMLHRLKGHEERALRIRAGMLEKENQLKSKIQRKCELAQTRREQLKQEQLEKLRRRERQAEKVRQNKERLSSENDEQQTASSV
jgi:hypothetical protein